MFVVVVGGSFSPSDVQLVVFVAMPIASAPCSRYAYYYLYKTRDVLKRHGFPPKVPEPVEEPFFRIGSIVFKGDISASIQSRPLQKEIAVVKLDMESFDDLYQEIQQRSYDNHVHYGKRGCTPGEVVTLLRTYLSRKSQPFMVIPENEEGVVGGSAQSDPTPKESQHEKIRGPSSSPKQRRQDDNNIDTPFVIGAPFSSVQNQGRFAPKRSVPTVSKFGIATSIARGGSSSSTTSSDEWDGETDEDEAAAMIGKDREVTETEDESQEEEDEVEDELNILDDNDEEYDEVEEEDEDEPALLHETEADSVQDFSEEDDSELEDDNEDDTEVGATIRAQEEAVLEEQIVAGMATTDDERSAFVDHMEFADAYDEGETTTGTVEDPTPVIAPGGGDGDDSDDGGDKVEETTTVATSTSRTEPEQDEPSSLPASVYEITEEMESILRKNLKYSKADIAVMRPDIAAIVVANSIQKPQEGMPPNFYKEGAVSSSSNSLRLGKVIKVTIVGVVAVGVATTAAGRVGLVDLDDFVTVLGKIPAALAKLAAIPAAISSLLFSRGQGQPTLRIEESKSQSSSASTATAEPTIEEEQEEDDDNPSDVGAGQAQIESVDDVRAHSVKPYSHGAPVENLDHTWLDKLITKIGRAFKGFFSIKI